MVLLKGAEAFVKAQGKYLSSESLIKEARLSLWDRCARQERRIYKPF